MVNLKDVSKSYDDLVVLNKVNINISAGEVVSLVGINGSGKSTLFKILTGEVSADSGQVDTSNEILAYLPQAPDFGDKTVMEFITEKLAPETIETYQIDIVLSQLQMTDVALNTQCSNLSGGEKTKLYIAVFLLKHAEPTVLVLDEPTNNLDLSSMDWLEKFIKDFKGAVIVTSHDRYFLDKVTTKTVELANGVLKSYGGNYTFYKAQKQTEYEAVERQYTAQQKKIKQVKEDIFDYKNRGLQGELKYTSRNPYQKKKAQKASRTAVVRQKKLEKFLESSNFIEKPEVRKHYGVTLSASVPSAKLILEVNNISKKFGSREVLKDINFSIRGNERMWVVGSNGSGKSTLCKTIVGELPQDSGSVRFGTNIKYGYLSQKSNFNPETTGLELLKNFSSDTTESFNIAAHIHLYEEELRKKIKQLSFGQIAKLEFVRLLVSNFDLLILDEPTNHLEIETREDIENAFQNYNGALLVVTHDRYFIETLGITKTLDL